MTHKSIYGRWVQKSSILISMLAFSCATFGQASFWSVFGNNGCSSTDDYNHTMPCTVAPSSSYFSFTSIPVLDVSSFSSYGNNDYFKNSVYDGSGRLLFSVNANGIYASDPSGTLVWGFGNAAFPYSWDGVTAAAGATLATTWAVSEIVTFPVPDDCTGYKYYVVFWCATNDLIGTENYGMILRCIEVDIQPAAFGVATDPTTWYAITDNAINPDPTGVNSIFGNGENAANCLIAVDAKNGDGSRDIYTVTPDVFTATSGPYIYYSSVKKWEFPSTGGLPTSPTTVIGYSSSPLLPCYTSKAEILTMPELSGSRSTTGFDKYLCFAVQYAGRGDENAVQTVDLTTGTISSRYIAPTSLPTPTGAVGTSTYGYQEVTGFEYLPAPFNELYFVYTDFSFEDAATTYPVQVSGLCTAPTPAISTNYTMTLTAGTSPDYILSDLLRDNNGDLYFVNTNLQALAYIATGTGGSIATASSPISSLNAATPATFAPFSSCTSFPYVSVNNFQPLANGSPIVPWYLGNQIRGENYHNWGYDVTANYNVTGTAYWTPEINPVTDITGVAIYTITVGGGITIQPGASLDISLMTVQMAPNTHIDVLTSPASSPNVGGRLELVASTVTGFPGPSPCNDNSTMWGGVRVWGDLDQVQGTLSGSHQGEITMTGSTISYAQTGVSVCSGGFSASGLLVPATGGGIIAAESSIFSNNTTGVYFQAYTSPDVFETNLSYLTGCNFTSTDASTVPPGSNLYGILGLGVSGININGCNFSNSLGSGLTSIGIDAAEMGFNVGITSPCTFSNYTDGIIHTASDINHTASIQNSIFNSNLAGVYINASLASVGDIVAGNTFNVPFNIVDGSSVITMHPPVYTTMRTVGVELFGNYLYLVTQNTFKEVPGTGPPFWSPGSAMSRVDNTVGILAWNTQVGNDENLIYENTFYNLGTANLGNYINRNNTGNGLWYACNTYHNDQNDEASEGTSAAIDGIRVNQGLPAGLGGSYLFESAFGAHLLDYAATATSPGDPAGNYFSTGSSVIILHKG